MANVIACSSIHWMMTKLIETIHRLSSMSRPSCHGVEEDLRKLEMLLLRIQFAVKYVEESARADEDVKPWLTELKDAAYDADDVLDEYEYDLLRNKVMVRASTEAGKQKDDSIFSCHKKLKDVAYDVQVMQSYLKEKVVKEMANKREREKEEEEEGNSSLTHKKHKAAASSNADDLLDLNKHKVVVEAKMEDIAASHKRKREEEEEVCNVISTLSNLSLTHGIADRIGSLVSKLQDIIEGHNDLGLGEEDGRMQPDDSSESNHPTSSNVEFLHFFGRDYDNEKIVELLVSDVQSNFQAIPIVGNGGIGKTTLAQLVYTDHRISNHFNLRGWVHVLGSFDLLQLVKEIIESFARKPCQLTEISAIQQILKQQVRGKRVFLVLDDLCNHQQSFCDSLRMLFSGSETVQIIITTRNNSVAEIVTTVPPYYLGCLPEDQSWLLFQHCAFDGHELNKNVNLSEIGRKIVKKCKGFPLSLKMLGNLLRYEADEQKWTDILENELWEKDESKVEILTALQLSYRCMPMHLKPCFSYCSLFPKGYKFSRDELVLLWMAQGYIQQKGSTRIEDTGAQYFGELVKRSFFQNADNNTEGDEHLFVLHDLIHDLVRLVSEKECSISTIEFNKSLDISDEVHHLHINISKSFQKQLDYNTEHKAPHLRTVLFNDKREESFGRDEDGLCVKILNDLSLCLQNLRSLELKSCWLFNLPDSIGNLKHLHYLHLSNSKIKKLPESVCQLYNLQVLILHHCEQLVELPKKIGNLISLCYLSCHGCKIQSLPESLCQLYDLRTLDLQQCENLTELPRNFGELTNLKHLKLSDNVNLCMPSGIGRLTCLETLEQLRLNRGSTSSGIVELKHLVNLRGKLCISGLRNVTDAQDAMEANLTNKKHITELRLQWNAPECDHNLEELDEVLLENLQPHTNLRRLDIYDYNGAIFPSWFSDPSFSNLITINLVGCNNERCNLPPSLGQLPALKYLHIEKMHGIQCIGNELLGNLTSSLIPFSSLMELKLCHLYGLEVWSAGDFPVLQCLTIENCPRLQRLPAFSSLCGLHLWGLDQLITINNFSSMASLQHLTIKHCPELRLSPNNDKIHQSLLQSQDVCIKDCPQLREWCYWNGIRSEDMIYQSKFINDTLF